MPARFRTIRTWRIGMLCLWSAAMLAAGALRLRAADDDDAAPAQPPATQPATGQGVDTVAPNDLLCIGIWDVRPTGGETLKTVRVDAKGFVTLYYVGQVKVGGLTFERAEFVIADAYRGNGITDNAAPSVNRLEGGAAPSVPSGQIAVGDRVSVRILDLVPDIEQSRLLTVSEGGKVGLPLLGQFKLAGLTEADAEAAISRAFEERFGLRHVPVSLLRLGKNQSAEPTVAAEPNARATSELPRARRR
jgi:protein involved in polysaccharide export with SLBB domain